MTTTPTPRNNRLRWIAPAAALALALGAPGVISAVANADPALPEKTAEELLADLAAAQPAAFSGTISQSVDLGLPDLSALTVVGTGGNGHSAAPFDPMTLATGTNTWRVWTDGETSGKAALVVDGGEYSVTYNGSDVWLWDSAAGEAAHMVLPEHSATDLPPDHTIPDHPPVTPDDLASELLERVEPSTEVSVSGTRMVAGRPAYELLLVPEDADTKIGEVRLALDSETSLPLALEVTSTSGTTAVDVAFTSIDFTVPDAAIFSFTPPADATVTEIPVPDKAEIEAAKAGADAHSDADADAASIDAESTLPAGTEPIVVGEGWSTVIVLPAASDSATDADALQFAPDATRPDSATEDSTWELEFEDPEAEQARAEAGDALASVLAQLPTVSGEWGSGRLFEGTIVSAVIADDGRVAVGAVGPEALYTALLAQ